VEHESHDAYHLHQSLDLDSLANHELDSLLDLESPATHVLDNFLDLDLDSLANTYLP
jgi:hypothetical protein